MQKVYVNIVVTIVHYIMKKKFNIKIFFKYIIIILSYFISICAISNGVFFINLIIDFAWKCSLSYNRYLQSSTILSSVIRILCSSVQERIHVKVCYSVGSEEISVKIASCSNVKTHSIFRSYTNIYDRIMRVKHSKS